MLCHDCAAAGREELSVLLSDTAGRLRIHNLTSSIVNAVDCSTRIANEWGLGSSPLRDQLPNHHHQHKEMPNASHNMTHVVQELKHEFWNWS